MDEQFSLFKNWMNDQKLLYVEVIFQKERRKQLFVRLLKYDELSQTLLLYDVDQKKVLSVKLNQIDSIQPAEAVG